MKMRLFYVSLFLSIVLFSRITLAETHSSHPPASPAPAHPTEHTADKKEPSAHAAQGEEVYAPSKPAHETKESGNGDARPPTLPSGTHDEHAASNEHPAKEDHVPSEQVLEPFKKVVDAATHEPAGNKGSGLAWFGAVFVSLVVLIFLFT